MATRHVRRRLGAQQQRQLPRVQRRHQQVPSAFAETLRWLYRESAPQVLDAVLRCAVEVGWTGTALGKALGITRERVLQRAQLGCPVRPAWLEELPRPPRRKVAPPALPKVRPQLPEDVARRLAYLQRATRRVNGGTPAGSLSREVSVEYAALLAELVGQGWAVVELARAAGVTHGAIRSRLGRHGHIPLPPSQADQVYKGAPWFADTQAGSPGGVS